MSVKSVREESQEVMEGRLGNREVNRRSWDRSGRGWRDIWMGLGFVFQEVTWESKVSPAELSCIRRWEGGGFGEMHARC